MAFQSTVNVQIGFGLPGEIKFDGPTRVESGRVNSSGTANTFGYAYTQDAATGVFQVGGTIAAGRVFGGILVDPKSSVNYGTTAGGPLAANLALPDGAQGEFLKMGEIVVNSATACSIGDLLVYDTTTGAISTVAAGSGSAGAGKAFVPNGLVSRFNTAAAGLIVAHLTN